MIFVAILYMNIRLLFLGCFVALSAIVWAQEPVMRLQRTPQEEAQTQTERLVRELGIQDSVRIDTLYRMHLKYALIRQRGLTRAENMERMNAIYAELKNLLTPEEFERFMNHPAELPRRPRGANVRMVPRSVQTTEPTPDTPSTPTENQ